MEGKPLLFVNSLNVMKKVNSNQCCYDSRVPKKVKNIDKLDLIYNLKKNGKNILCEFLFDDKYYEGYISNLNNETIKIEAISGNEYTFKLQSLEKINILKI